jgi:hypothetical protein
VQFHAWCKLGKNQPQCDSAITIVIPANVKRLRLRVRVTLVAQAVHGFSACDADQHLKLKSFQAA